MENLKVKILKFFQKELEMALHAKNFKMYYPRQNYQTLSLIH